MEALLDAFACPLCRKHLVDPVSTVDCLHTFCSSCLDQYLFATHRACPTCSRPQTPGITIKPHVAFNNLHAKSLALQRFLGKEEVAGKEEIVGKEVVEKEIAMAVIDTQEIEREKEIVQRQMEVVERLERVEQRVLGSSTLSFARRQQLQARFGECGDRPTHFVTKATRNPTTGEWQCAPTFKYYWAISVGAKVVREEWLDSRDGDGGEDKFQVKSTTCTFTKGPTLRLFAGQSFQLGPFSAEHTLQRAQAASLIELHGGTVVDLGGNPDGTGMARPTGRNAIVLVGHPIHFQHANNQCQFCSNVLSSSSSFELTLVESTWIILCLGSGKLEGMEDRLLTGSL